MDDSGEMTVIAAETQIKGELEFEGAARIIGKVEGRITAKGDLHVDERGTCKATVEAANIQVDGIIEGDVNASERVQLNAQGRIHGDIVAQKLITAEGATIMGHVNIGLGANKGERRTAPSPAKAVEAAVAEARAGAKSTGATIK